MTISDPKFHAGQYVFYDGEVSQVSSLLGYKFPDDPKKTGWYYEIATSRGYDTVKESYLSGDIDTEYDRMQKRVENMEDQLEGMLFRYKQYLDKVDNLIKSKEA